MASKTRNERTAPLETGHLANKCNVRGCPDRATHRALWEQYQVRPKEGWRPNQRKFCTHHATQWLVKKGATAT